MKKFMLISLLILSFSANSQEISEELTFWQKFRAYAPIVQAAIVGRLDSLGISFRAMLKPNMPDWYSITQGIEEDLQFASCRDNECDGTFANDLALVSGARIGYADDFEILESMESFELRKKLILSAKKSIYIIVWAIYDDGTGKQLQDLLLEALNKNKELDIKLIVDGHIATTPGHHKVLQNLQSLSKDKIQIIKWKSWRYRANGTHRKIFIVDNEHVITGGINIGNKYSHYFIDRSSDKWRDVDLYIKGKYAGAAAQNQFAKIWNDQLNEWANNFKEPLAYNELSNVEFIERGEGAKVLFVDQNPGDSSEQGRYNIHSAITHLFRTAQRSIDIENAYFILDPHMRSEFEKALKRGVEIRVFTNSEHSVDEPIVSLPILDSAKWAAKKGVKVYLKNGSTLHSKHFVVDNKISVIGSYNFHPQSLKFYGENIAIVFNEKLANRLTHKIEKGLTEAIEVHKPDSLNIPFNMLGSLMKVMCYDCL